MLAECYFFTGMTLVPDLVPVGSALVPGSACSKIAVNNNIWPWFLGWFLLVPGLACCVSLRRLLLLRALAWRNAVNYRPVVVL